MLDILERERGRESEVRECREHMESAKVQCRGTVCRQSDCECPKKKAC